GVIFTSPEHNWKGLEHATTGFLRLSLQSSALPAKLPGLSFLKLLFRFSCSNVVLYLFIKSFLFSFLCLGVNFFFFKPTFL
ncbi:MAG: hypothetical protein ACTSP3_09795, partial [Candidatus Heimdallarchaeaceae archaeon]